MVADDSARPEDSSMWNEAVRYTRIKLCEFEALDPAYEASHLGADALGFHIFCHQDVDEKVARFRGIFGYLPAGVDKVLLTDVDFEVLVRILGSLPVDTVQLYPDWAPEKVAALRARVRPGLRILKVLSAQPEENAIANPREFVRAYGGVVEGFLLDSYRAGGTGKTADWDRCAAVVRSTPLPVFLAGGLTVDNVAEAIRRVRPFGVDVETGVSDRVPNGPLVKNMAKCARFIEAVRQADRALLDAPGRGALRRAPSSIPPTSAPASAAAGRVGDNARLLWRRGLDGCR